MTSDLDPSLPTNVYGNQILLDSNLLLLLFVGLVSQETIQRFKRTAHFTITDFRLLEQVLNRFRQIVTTPNIVTEVSNFCGQLSNPLRETTRRFIGSQMKVLAEEYVATSAAAHEPSFARLGVTDAVIAVVGQHDLTVLTVDSVLHDHLERNGVRSLNFNHLRTYLLH